MPECMIADGVRSFENSKKEDSKGKPEYDGYGCNDAVGSMCSITEGPVAFDIQRVADSHLFVPT